MKIPTWMIDKYLDNCCEHYLETSPVWNSKEHYNSTNTKINSSEDCPKQVPRTQIFTHEKNHWDLAGEIIPYNPLYDHLVVVKIISCTPHPNADRLQICKVLINNNDDELTIVCGASNINVSGKYILAPVGTYLPVLDHTITEKNIRGQTSQGMLCSLNEIGITHITSNSEDILMLPPSANVGSKFSALFTRQDRLYLQTILHKVILLLEKKGVIVGDVHFCSKQEISDIITPPNKSYNGRNTSHNTDDSWTQMSKKLRIAEVIDYHSHPINFNLLCARVKTKDGTFHIVCPNIPHFHKGQKYIFAPAGIILDTGEIVLNKSIYGQNNEGKICTYQDLDKNNLDHNLIMLDKLETIHSNLDDNDTYKKINAKRYQKNLRDILLSESPIIELEVPPNKSHFCSAFGLAREIKPLIIDFSKQLGIDVKFKKINLQASISVENDTDPIYRVLNNTPQCTHCFFGCVKNINLNAPSPKWLQIAVVQCGYKPCNPVQDIINYVRTDMGCPLTAYDANTIGPELLITETDNTDTITTPNGEQYTIPAKSCVVCNANKKIFSLANIVNTNNATITPNTKNVYVESMLVNPQYVSATGQKMNILTPNLKLAERGCDPNVLHSATYKAVRLIKKTCGGTPDHLLVLSNTTKKTRIINLQLANIHRKTGFLFTSKQVIEKLTNYGFLVNIQNTPNAEDTTLEVTIPSWRMHDCVKEIDLIEDIVRISSDYMDLPMETHDSCKYYNNHLSATNDKSQENNFSTTHRVRKIIRDVLSIKHLETVTYPFINQDYASAFISDNQKTVSLQNPPTSHMSAMQPTILCSLLSAAATGLNQKHPLISMFEIGPTFVEQGNTAQNTKNKPLQREWLGIIQAGNLSYNEYKDNLLKTKERCLNFYDAKYLISSLLEMIGICENQITFTTNAPHWYISGQSASCNITTNNTTTTVAYLGNISEKILALFDIKKHNDSVIAVELDIDQLIKIIKTPSSPSPIVPPTTKSVFPAVQRDFSFIINNNITAQMIINCVQDVNSIIKEHPTLAATNIAISNINIFDIYENETLKAQQQKSVAFSVQMQSYTQTLTQEVILATCNLIVTNIKNYLQGILR